MGELFDYALAMRKISDEQAKRTQTALALLRTAGLPKTIEEAAILCGALTRPQYDALAKEVAASWKVRPPVPRIAAPDQEKDDAVAAAFRQQGRRREVDMAEMRQQMLRAGGIDVPLWEIIESGDEGKTGGSSEKGEMIDALEMAPPPPKSKFAKKIETPVWLEDQAPPRPKPAPPKAPPPPKPKPPLPAPEPIMIEQHRLQDGPAPAPPAPKPVPAKPPAVRAQAPPAAAPPAPRPPSPPKPPTVRAQAAFTDGTERLRQSIRKLDMMIGITAGALALVIILIIALAAS